jgi:hypothetical protein
MSHAKRRSRAKAVTVLGVAGALSLAGGASEAAVGPVGDTRRRTRHQLSPSVRKKSRTSAWRLFMSSTMKTPEHIVPAYNLPRGHAATDAPQFTEAAEAAQAAGVAEAARAAQAPEGRMVSREFR